MEKLLIALLLLGVVGCAGGGDDGQDFGNIFETPEGIVLTEGEHPDGWGRDDCFACHPLEEIHRKDRTQTLLLPIEEIQAFVEAEGLDSCVVCHGDNGVGE